jgi:hypothetical protein
MIVALGLAAAGGFATAAVWMKRAGADGIATAPTLHYSGTVLDAGAPFNGVKTIGVSVWTAPDGGTMVCERPPAAVPIASGRFRVELPETCVTAVRMQPNLWVQATVEATTFPRTKLGAVPYAVQADRATQITGLAVLSLVPSGAVMAFDLDACPLGWTEMTRAKGRTIVGASDGHPRNQMGGGETVTLTEGQLPAHRHPVSDPGHVHPAAVSTFIQGGAPGEGPANIAQGGNSYVFTRNTGSAGTGISVGNTGGGQPVPVMPPFLALIYCKKM